MRKLHKIVLAAVGIATLPISAFVVAREPDFDKHRSSIPRMPVDKVLDGDTVVKDGEALHIRGMDAPELGPWAKCWAEAALAGHAKNALETALFNQQWKLVDREMDGQGRLSIRIVDKDGFDIWDTLSVNGYVAVTDQRWDWCGSSRALQPVEDESSPPHGPNLWWPTGTVFDARAAD